MQALKDVKLLEEAVGLESPSNKEKRVEQISQFEHDLRALTRMKISDKESTFEVRGYFHKDSLIMGYLVEELEDYAILAFAHMFKQEESSTLIQPLIGTSSNLFKLYHKSACLGSIIPDDKHTLLFLECTYALLGNLSGYFDEKKILNVNAVRQALRSSLGVIVKGPKSSGLSSETESPSSGHLEQSFTPFFQPTKIVRH